MPAGVFAGAIGVAPSQELFERARDARGRAGGHAAAARAADARAGAAPPPAADGLRTYPPRENGGNMDVRDLVAGQPALLPVHVPGALLSIGDLHFAQGDGEVCISAIETGGSATFRVGLRADGWRPRFPPRRRRLGPAGVLRHHRHPPRRRRHATGTSTSTSPPGAP